MIKVYVSMRYGRVGKFKVQVNIVVEGGSGRDDMIAKKDQQVMHLVLKGNPHCSSMDVKHISLSLWAAGEIRSLE